MRLLFLFLLTTSITFSLLNPVQAEDKGWKTIFDGKTFNGWKASENKDSWKIEEEAFVCNGNRSHLFYTGDDKPFKNFEFKCQVKTLPKSNAGIYFHTKYQETGWPKFGYEAQVNNTHRDPKKTGSLYAVKNVFEAPAKDNEWFDYYIKVVDKKILIVVNGKTCVDWKEPADRKAGKDFTRALGQGTFCFQAHDPISKVYFRNIEVKRLP